MFEQLQKGVKVRDGNMNPGSFNSTMLSQPMSLTQTAIGYQINDTNVSQPLATGMD